MPLPNRPHKLLNCLLFVILLLSGCTTAPHWKTTPYGTMKFSQEELLRLPEVAIMNILSSMSVSEHERVQILVRSTRLEEMAEAIRPEDPEGVIVTDRNGKELHIRIGQITEIVRVRHFLVMPHKKASGNKAAAVGEVLIEAPLIPIALATVPFLTAGGLNAARNDDDKEKALLAYGGLSKKELIMYIGEPREKYRCRDKGQSDEKDVWVYENDQVLRGGRVLFISSDKGVVYYTSHNTSFFKNPDYHDCVELAK